MIQTIKSIVMAATWKEICGSPTKSWKPRLGKAAQTARCTEIAFATSPLSTSEPAGHSAADIPTGADSADSSSGSGSE